MQNVQFGPRLAADTTALCVRSVSTFVTVAVLDLGVLGFGISQMIYGATHLLVIVAHSGVLECNDNNGKNVKALSVSSYFPGVLTGDEDTSGDEDDGKELDENILSYVSKRILGVAVVTTGSSLLKHVLTEADKIVLTFTRDR